MSDSKDLIEIFNKKFHTKFKCLFFEENKTYENFNYKNTEIPIIILKNEQTNNYTTIKELNHNILLTALITNYNVRNDLKLICSKFFNDEISKNI